MNIFCDIDGTLTDDGKCKNGNPIIDRIQKLNFLSKRHQVILWSGNGKEYAEQFKKQYGLNNCIAIGKPHLIIDDNPTIRPKWDSLIQSPDYLGEIK